MRFQVLELAPGVLGDATECEIADEVGRNVLFVDIVTPFASDCHFDRAFCEEVVELEHAHRRDDIVFVVQAAGCSAVFDASKLFLGANPEFSGVAVKGKATFCQSDIYVIDVFLKAQKGRAMPMSRTNSRSSSPSPGPSDTNVTARTS